MFCHRFYALTSHTRTENDWHVLAPACLFLAGKVEETPKALRDVVFVVYMLRHRKEPEKAQEALKNNKARPRRARVCTPRACHRACAAHAHLRACPAPAPRRCYCLRLFAARWRPDPCRWRLAANFPAARPCLRS